MSHPQLKSAYEVLESHVKELSKNEKALRTRLTIETTKSANESKAQKKENKKLKKDLKTNQATAAAKFDALQSQLDKITASLGAPNGGSPSAPPSRDLRVLGGQTYNRGLIDDACKASARDAYATELSSCGLWTVLRQFASGGDRCVPRLVDDSPERAIRWSDQECNVARAYIVDSSSPLIEYAMIHALFSSPSPSGVPASTLPSTSTFHIPQPYQPQPQTPLPSFPLKRPAMNFTVPDPKRACFASHEPTVASLQNEIAQIRAQMQNAPPTTQLQVRQRMFSTRTPLDEGVRGGHKRLARDRVTDWLSGKSSFLPKMSEFFTAMNREDHFLETSRSHVVAILTFILTGLATPAAVYRARNNGLSMEVRDILSKIAALGDTMSNQSGIMKSVVRELNRTQSFSHASLMLSIGYQQILTQQGIKKEPTTSSTSSSAGTNRRNTSNKSSNASRSSNTCYYCKQPGHPYKECKHRLNNKLLPKDWYCAAFNTRSGCSKAGRTCDNVHRCFLCSDSHGSFECESDV